MDVTRRTPAVSEVLSGDGNYGPSKVGMPSRHRRTSSQSATCRYQAQRVTGRGCATPSCTTVAGRQPTWTARPTAAAPARAGGRRHRSEPAVGRGAPAARPHRDPGGCGLEEVGGRRRHRTGRRRIGRRGGASGGAPPAGDGGGVRPGRDHQPAGRSAQREHPVAVRLAVHRPGRAADLAAADQHAARVVADQRGRAGDAVAGQLDGRGAVRQAPEALRPPTGGRRGRRRARRRAGPGAGGARARRRGRRPCRRRRSGAAGRPAAGRCRRGRAGRARRPRARWGRDCSRVALLQQDWSRATLLQHPNGRRPPRRRIVPAGQEHHARVVVPHVIRYPSLPAPRRTGAP